VKNQYRYQVMERLNVREGDLAYLDRLPAAASHEGQEPANVSIGSVPPPESDLAAMERELLKLLFHEPAFVVQAVTEVDLAALTGTPEKQIGQAMLEALGEGKLPPDVEALSQADAGCLVARELLPRLPGAQGGDASGDNRAQALCIALAEALREGAKLSSDLRLRMCVRRLRRAVLEDKIRIGDRRLAYAQLNKDDKAAAETYENLVLLRKELSKLKSLPLK
jgi:hypothetical protein